MRTERAGSITALEMMSDLFGWGLLLSGIALIGITVYYIFGTLMHSEALFRGMSDGRPMSVPDFMRQLNNMKLFTNALFILGIILALGAVGRFYQAPEAGVALIVLGALLCFGMPYLIDSSGGAEGMPPSLLRLGNPRDLLRARYALTGIVVMAVGGAHLLSHAFYTFVGSKKRRPKANEEAAKTAQQVRKSQDRFLGKCWELPFCRDTDKKLCPVRTTKVPCWRKGRGCYCDQNIILTLSGGNVYAASRGASGYLSRTASVTRPKTMGEKRDQCLQCPVYLHHQSQKYRLLAPGVVLLAIGLFILFFGTITHGYPATIEAIGRRLSSFSFGAAPGGVPGWAADLASNTPMMWLLILVAGLMLIAYLLHGVEWLLYRLGI